MNEDLRQRISAAIRVLNDELASVNLDLTKLSVDVGVQRSARPGGEYAPKLFVRFTEAL